MASVSISPAPSKVPIMAQRRVPLGDIPNAANSPRRPSAATKRARLDPEAKEDNVFIGERPAKRQALTAKIVAPRTPRRQSIPVTGEAVFEDRKLGRPTAFERKLLAAKERAAAENQPKQERHSRSEEDLLEDIRTWQRNTRRAFPSFVFYFEGIPDDVRRRYLKQIKALGAREERFFSREITHVITTRSLEPTKSNGHNGDILARAKEMGMKVWQLEKLHRVFQSLLDDRPSVQTTQGRTTRQRIGQIGDISQNNGEADLSRLLKKEQLNGPLDRDSTATSEEIIPFKAFFLYVRCIDERTKPILLKEYPKVSNKDDGEWPRFRACRSGRCPFVEDPEFSAGMLRRSSEDRRPRRSKRKQAEAMIKLDEKSAISVGRRPLAETKNGVNRQPVKPEKLPQMDFCVPALPHHKDESSGSRKPMMQFQGNRMINGEPAASGVQPSNITSAIRSQMISSTAAGPGAKASTSREVHGLKRRVLEKNYTGQIPPNSIQVAQRHPPYFNDPARAEAAIPSKEARTRAQQKQLRCVEEDESTQSMSEEGARACQELTQGPEKSIKVSNKPKKGEEEREKPSRPGYCENCREKYADFDAHIVGRRHREFALNQANWLDLDRLLDKLDRPLRINSSVLTNEEASF